MAGDDITPADDSGPPTPRVRASDADRDEALSVLQEAHVAGRLDVTEFSDRQDAVLAARFLDELIPQVDDVPEGEALCRRLRHDVGMSPSSAAVPALRPHTTPAVTGETPELSFAVMSGKDIVLEPGTTIHRSFQWWGGHDYDLTEVMGPGVVVTLELYAVMAGSDIRVPEGVRVIDETVNIMAGSDVRAKARGDGSNGTLILKGFSFWAGHDVKLMKDKQKKKK